MKENNTAVIKTDWQDLTEENITKLYLYGDLKAHDLTSSEIHRRGNSNDTHSAQVTIQLNNFYDYMANDESPIRYANLSQIPIVEKFFTEKTHTFKEVDPDRMGTPELVPNFDALSEGNYTIDEIRKHFHDPLDRHANDKHYSIQHMKYDPLSDDYDKRVYVFNSQAIHLGNEATFVVKPNGERLIENAAPTISSEDFDFVSREPKGIKDVLVKAGNDLYLKPNIDPLGIGCTVNIDYPKGGKEPDKDTGLYDNPPEYTQYIQEYAKAHGPYTKDTFENDLQRYEQEYSPAKGIANVAPAMSRVIDNLWESNTTKFLDNEGNAIIYEKDTFEHTNYTYNTNMQSYLQDSNKNYHFIDRNTGKEEIIEIPHPQRESVVEQTAYQEEKDYDDSLSSDAVIESCSVSNEVVEMIARENERPVTTMIREMQESAEDVNESSVGRTLYDDYDSMD